jgi:hypothetical protein
LTNYVQSWDDAIDQLTDVEDVTFYVYLCDEPNTKAAYDYVRELGGVIQGTNLQHIEILVVEQTTPDYGQTPGDWGDLYGAVDIWCPSFCAFDPAAAAARQALGERVWAYTALAGCENRPFWHIDYPLIHYRVPTWIAWHYGQPGLLYWSMATWYLTPDPALWPDIWLQPPLYVQEWAGHTFYYNGEGVLVYPAAKVGYDGVVPSLRLKALRDAIEDYEYLALMERAGLGDEAQAIISPIVTSWSDYDTDPLAYEHTRVQLAALLVSSRQNAKIFLPTIFRAHPPTTVK